MVKQYIPNQFKQSILKKTFWDYATKLKIASIIRLFHNKNSYLVDQGWFKSVRRGKSVDGKGFPLPWLTYPFINFLEPRLNKNFTMFEFGCGNSTLWFAERVGQIFSVEHDKGWYDEICKNLPENAKIVLKEIVTSESYSAITFMSCSDETSYSSEVKSSKQLYDIILVDGVYRNNSVINSVNALKETGVIIIDNVDYVESNEATEYLFKLGFKRIEFWGMCPIAHHDSCTSVFYRSDNCLNI